MTLEDTIIQELVDLADKYIERFDKRASGGEAYLIAYDGLKEIIKQIEDMEGDNP